MWQRMSEDVFLALTENTYCPMFVDKFIISPLHIENLFDKSVHAQKNRGGMSEMTADKKVNNNDHKFFVF